MAITWIDKARALVAARETVERKIEAKRKELDVAGRSVTSSRAQARLSRMAKELDVLQARLERIQGQIEAHHEKPD